VKSRYRELENDFEMSSALMAAILSNHELLKNLQLQYANWQRKIKNDGINPVRSKNGSLLFQKVNLT